MKFNTNRKIAAAGAAILLGSLIVSLTPWYKAYCAYDARWTCAKVRAEAEIRYSELGTAGNTGYAYGSKELILLAWNDVIAPETRDFEPDYDGYVQHKYLLHDVCRDGGTIHIQVQDNGNMLTYCDAENHDVTYGNVEEVN